MSLKNLQYKSAAALDEISKDVPKAANPERPTTSPGVTMLAANMAAEEINKHAERSRVAEEKAAAAETRLSEIEERLKDAPNEIPVDSIKIINERRRKLSPEQFTELKDNLKNNPLVQPISVKRLVGDAKYNYELISGHNRLDVFRILGRSTIPVCVVDIKDDRTAERSAFFANLLQPELLDYERFLGFKKWQDDTGESQSEIADSSGISKATISKLFKFGDLPEDVLAIIAEQPAAVGLVCASELAKLEKEGRGGRIVEAVRMLADGLLTQKDAVKFAARKEQEKPREKVDPVAIRAGRFEYCRYIAKGGMLKIDFKTEEARSAAEEIIAAVLNNLASQSKQA